MKHLAITGGIAAGKTTVASFFARRGIPVFDADASARALYSDSAFIDEFAKYFQEFITNGTIDKAALRLAVRDDNGQLLDGLEQLLHPFILAQEQDFIKRARRRGLSLIVSDIPLLCEAAWPTRYEIRMLVSAPDWLRIRRAISRPGMDDALLKSIMQRQYTDAQKRRLCDIEITTGLSKADTTRQISSLLYLFHLNNWGS